MELKLPHKILASTKYTRPYILRAAIFAFALLWLVFFISNIPGQGAIIEQATGKSVSTLQNIFENPINAPYKLVAFVSSSISSSILSIRAVSLLVTALTTMALFYTLRHWHTRTVATLVTGLFITNAFVLSVGRLGAPLTAVFGWFIFTSLLLWQVHGNSNKVIPGSVLLAVAVMLYIPGALWFFLVFLAFYWDRFKVAFKYVRPKSVAIGIIAATILCAPLLFAFFRDPGLIRDWLLLPDTFSLQTILESALQVPSSFIYKMDANPLLNVGTLPVFDLASGFLFLFGLYAYSKKLKLDRTRLIVAMALVALIIGSFGDNVTAVVVLLPFAYSVIGAGIEYLLDEWNSVFPRNPYARSFGILIITTVVLFGSYYQLTRFLVAWPQTPETRAVYTESRIIEQ